LKQAVELNFSRLFPETPIEDKGPRLTGCLLFDTSQSAIFNF
jgi:hypothetical protein